ncbi:MAG: hypothetical protein K8T26_05445 [Lentisphaerae bacterium]|nr:hypothetical protein [Lentisphaerota bacterium]
MKMPWVWACLLAVTASSVWAQTPDAGAPRFGLGLILGEPTGISAKYWLSSTRALDAAAAWSLSDDERVQLHADYLLHNEDLIHPKDLHEKLPVYYGIGGRILLSDSDNGRGHDDDERLGIRFPLGVTYLFVTSPLDVFAEIVPVLDLVPDTDLELSAAIGARFYFN